ncbi:MULTISPECIES: hypothetical protein [Deinococcus]|uniref:hypothetical protein n=1 Tax=Deinococcus TaxID=1298 RepID=UPI0018DF8C8B|nr:MULTISPECIES: hypothetical protein [Deinococcus]MBI0447195.1 hypothetical protein [Deinococcus sp. DB0503]
MTETLLFLPRTRAGYRRARHLRRFFKRQNRQQRRICILVPRCTYAVRVTRTHIVLTCTRTS